MCAWCNLASISTRFRFCLNVLRCTPVDMTSLQAPWHSPDQLAVFRSERAPMATWNRTIVSDCDGMVRGNRVALKSGVLTVGESVKWGSMWGFPCASSGREALSRWWFWLNMLALFPVASAGREAFEWSTGPLSVRAPSRTATVNQGGVVLPPFADTVSMYWSVVSMHLNYRNQTSSQVARDSGESCNNAYEL